MNFSKIGGGGVILKKFRSADGGQSNVGQTKRFYFVRNKSKMENSKITDLKP